MQISRIGRDKCVIRMPAKARLLPCIFLWPFVCFCGKPILPQANTFLATKSNE